jgi:hypothetical protein
MKKPLLSMAIIVSLLLCTNGIQAQTTQTQLNQLELIKQFIGTWTAEMGKDTTLFCEYKLFGTGMEDYYKAVTKGEIFLSEKGLWGYDKENDKNIHVQLWDHSSRLDINVWWFTSKNICEGVQYQYISNPEDASLKWGIEFKSSDLMIMTTTLNSKVVSTMTFTREKK